MRLFLCYLLLAFVSCTKENDPESKPKTSEEQISELIDKIIGAHTNGVKYCHYEYLNNSFDDTSYNYPITIVRYNDTMFSIDGYPWRFFGNLEKKDYNFMPVSPSIHVDYVHINATATILRYDFGKSALGQPWSCYVIMNLE